MHYLPYLFRHPAAMLLLMGICCSASSLAQPAEVIARLKQDSRFKGASWSVTAVVAATGEHLVGYQEGLRLAPASNLKIVTTAAALLKLGGGFRFSTTFFIDGKVRKNTLHGNLIIAGGGDPALGSRFTKETLPLDSIFSAVTAALRWLGIKKIAGDVIADPSVFTTETVPDYFPAIDIGNYYGSGVSGLTVLDNTYTVTFAPGSSVGDSAALLRVTPVLSGFTFHNEMLTGEAGSGDNGYIYAYPGTTQAWLRGTVPAGEKEFSIKGSLPNPPLSCADSLYNYLLFKNISVVGKAAVLRGVVARQGAGLQSVYTCQSPPLSEIVRIINKRSNNLFTEHLLAALSMAPGVQASVSKGLDSLLNVLSGSGIAVKDVSLYDGSGLSRVNCVTTSFMASVLAMMSRTAAFTDYYASFPVAGDSSDIGGFRRFGAGTAIALNARIKSGLINGVRGLTGYVTDRRGRLLAFSCIANNHTVPSSQIDDAFREFILSLAELN